MGLDIGWVKEIQFLPCPGGPVYEFACELAEASNGVIGEFTRSKLLSTARKFCSQRRLRPQEAKSVEDWVKSLPWDRDGYITFYFSY